MSLTSAERLKVSAALKKDEKSPIELTFEKIRAGKIKIKNPVYFSDPTKVGASKCEVGVTTVDGV